MDGDGQLSRVTAFVGELVWAGEGLRFAPTAGDPFDAGPTFSAPQLLVDGARTLL